MKKIISVIFLILLIMCGCSDEVTMNDSLSLNEQTIEQLQLETTAEEEKYNPLNFENQKALVSYIREDLAPYAEEGGIYFIDAGISNGPYCEPAYPAVNEAKRQFSELSPLNIYFSTIDEGLTTLYEPEGEPDYGHYDALFELELGRIFADHIIESYKKR